MPDMNNQIVQLDFPETEYYKSTYEKTQIVLHHTVSDGSAQSVATYWTSLENRIGTPVVIDKEGVINQLFSSRYYAGHVGDTEDEMHAFSLPYRSCSKTSIGVELVNMGGLTEKDGKLTDAYGQEFKGEYVHYPAGYRSYNYFARYTDKQLESLRRLLIYWCNRYDIPNTYYPDIWSVNRNALRGDSGIYTHASFRYDKSDTHPQPELVTMLKNLTLCT